MSTAVSSKSPAAPQVPLKILVVEDSPDDRALYRRILHKDPGAFEILEADSVSQGLEMTGSAALDCIVLDYQLPDGDGLRFIESYKKKNAGSEVAVVMVTGRGNAETAVEAMKLGALDYIVKDRAMEGYFVQSILNAVERAHLKTEVTRYQEELEKSYKALSEFTHTVSHDIKAPLRHIASYCGLLKEDYGDKLGEEGRQYADRLIVNAKRLQKLVDDLLDYSRALNMQEEAVELDMGALVSEVAEELEELISGEGAEIVQGPMPKFRGYPLRMRQMLQNLITNAVKYKSDQKPVIKISGEDKGDHWLWRVEDNGSGIKKEYQDSIFEPFKRLHSKDVIEGTGLGLSICKKVAEMHGGKIWVESEPGQGATFFFTIKK